MPFSICKSQYDSGKSITVSSRSIFYSGSVIRNMSVYDERIVRFREELEKNGIKGAMVLSRENICYLTGFCVGGYERLTALIVGKTETSLVVPKLSLGQIEDITVDNRLVWDDRADPYGMASTELERLTLEGLGVEATMPLSHYLKFRKYIGNEPKPVDKIIQKLRMRKSEDEIASIRKAVEISENALEATISEIRAGMTEKEVAGILEYNMRRKGSDGNAFATTIAAGLDSANPHHITSEHKIQEGDSIVIDFGASYHNYSADTTRTLVLGKASEEFRKVYNTVKKAQETGIEYARPGMPAGDIDIKVREVIENAGYGQYFTHRTGHGIGLETHEGPYINESDRTPLEPPVTFTVEPGIYMLGKFGVRIEDVVLLDQKGARPVNRFTKDLTEI